MRKKPSIKQKTASPTPQKPSYHERIKGEKRKAAIEAAIEVFLEHGYERSSLQQIATRANVSTATLFKRFPTKAALFEAIVLDFWSEDAAIGRIPPIGDPKAGLRRIGSDFAAVVRMPRIIAFFRLICSEAPRFPELGRMVLESGKMPYINRVRDYLKGEVEAGRLRINDTRGAARQFLNMIAGQIFWPVMFAADLKVTDRDAKLAVDEALQTILARYEVSKKH